MKTARLPRRLRTLVVCALVVAGCGTQSDPSATTEYLPVDENPEQRDSSRVLSALDIDPGYSEVGAWWYVANSTLAVRGKLGAVVDGYNTGEIRYEVWSVEVSEVLLGEYTSAELLLSQFSRAQIEAGWHFMQTPWEEGYEAIFFLTPQFGPELVPDLYMSVHGSVSVVEEDLDYWSEHLPKAAGALGLFMLGDRSDDQGPFVEALTTEVVVEGTIESLTPASTIQDWEYTLLALPETTVVWSPRVSLDEEAGNPFEYPTDFKVATDTATAQQLRSGDRVRLKLRRSLFPDPDGPMWVIVGGAKGILDTEVDPVEVAEELDLLRSQRNPAGSQLVVGALGVLKPLNDAFGRIPLPVDDEGEPWEPEPIDFLELYRSPLVIEQSDVIIAFDKWFFALLDGTGRVTVSDSTGRVLAEGPVEGAERITRELADLSIDFLDLSGDVVANLTADELGAAVEAALKSFEDQHRQR